MPVINVKTVIRVPVLESDEPKYIELLNQDKKPITLRLLAFTALNNAPSFEFIQAGGQVYKIEVDGDTKFKRAYLAQRFYEAKETIDLEASDVTVVKECISKSPGNSPWVTFAAWSLLELKPQPGDPIPDPKPEEKA